MTDKEFVYIYKYVEDYSARYKKRDSNDWLELTVYVFDRLSKNISYQDALSRVRDILFTKYRKEKSDEYYEPTGLYKKNEYGKFEQIDPSENHRIHTAYGKDISSVCIGCGKRYIKTGERQKYCNPRCRKRAIYKNINKL